MGLDIGMFRSEEAAGPIPGQIFSFVHHFAATVIAAARVAFRILVGKDRALGFQYSGAYKVLRGNQLDIVILALQLLFQDGSQFRVEFP